MKIGAVINDASGVLSPEEAKQRLDNIKKELENRISPHLLAIVPGSAVKKELERVLKNDLDVLIIGGGDGTVSTAAGLIANTKIALLVLALGTRNNFARDAGIPLDPLEAISLLDKMQVLEIDMGEVNDHKFINNATVGLYPKMVREREARTDVLGWRKRWAQIASIFVVFKRLPRMRMTIDADEINITVYTPFLFVGNNEYQEIVNPNYSRESLNEGKLWLCIARSSGFGSLLLMVLHLTFKGIRKASNLETHLLTELTVNTWKKRVTVAIDGENHNLNTPLRFKILNKSLRLVIP